VRPAALLRTIGVALVSGLALACGQPAGKGRIHVLVIANTDIRDIPLGLAIEDLKAQGYRAEVTPMLNGALMPDALARGDAEIGSFNNETLWTAVAKGVRARTLMQRLSFPNLLVTRAGVTGCGALNGKPIALGAQGGLNPRLIGLYFDRQCPGTKPHTMVIPDSTARSAALASGAVDAALVPLEELVKLREHASGAYDVLVDLTKAFPLLQVTGVHARLDWLEQNPRAARDFIRALLLAHRKIVDDPQILYALAAGHLKLAPDATKPIVDASLAAGAWDPNGALTEENVKFTLRFLKDVGAVPPALEFDAVADLSHLNAVLREIGRR
jgi:hypothetical protein